MRYLFTASLVLVAQSAGAAIDYTCMDRCSRQGYQYQYCQEVCSYNMAPPPPPPPPPIYSRGPSQTNAAIARGFPGVDLSGTLSAIAAMRAREQEIQLQREQAEAQRRYLEEQTRAQQLANERQAAESNGSGAGPQTTEHDRAAFIRWVNAAATRKHLFADFEQVVFAEDLVISDSMVELMAESPFAADIAYFLGKNKSESARIAELPILDQAVAIKQIEKRVQSK